MSEGKKIFIEPAKGEMTDDEALAVAKSPWGKRLIEAGNLTFEKKIEVKEENVQHGMTIKPGDVKKPGKGKGKKPSPPQGGDEGNAGNGDGNEADSTGDEGDKSSADENTETEGGEQIPDFDKNTEGSNTGEE
jgi:hypothetical protein